jgi:hypothetical protein
VRDNDFVASIFFAFFRPFLAIVSPRLPIRLPGGRLST